MIESWKASGLAAMALVVAIAMGVGLQAWSLGGAPDYVIVRDGPWDAQPVPVSPPKAALAYASSLAGFTVTAPAFIPAGFKLTEIQIGGPPALIPGVCFVFIGPSGAPPPLVAPDSTGI